jgi:hypothetical protein
MLQPSINGTRRLRHCRHAVDHREMTDLAASSRCHAGSLSTVWKAMVLKRSSAAGLRSTVIRITPCQGYEQEFGQVDPLKIGGDLPAALCLAEAGRDGARPPRVADSPVADSPVRLRQTDAG